MTNPTNPAPVPEREAENAFDKWYIKAHPEYARETKSADSVLRYIAKRNRELCLEGYEAATVDARALVETGTPDAGYHICKGGIFRRYSTLVCSMCKPDEGVNLVPSALVEAAVRMALEDAANICNAKMNAHWTNRKSAVGQKDKLIDAALAGSAESCAVSIRARNPADIATRVLAQSHTAERGTE